MTLPHLAMGGGRNRGKNFLLGWDGQIHRHIRIQANIFRVAHGFLKRQYVGPMFSGRKNGCFLASLAYPGFNFYGPKSPREMFCKGLDVFRHIGWECHKMPSAFIGLPQPYLTLE